MNKGPIENALDRDLRLSQAAMRRAAERARELAAKTGTSIVVSHKGVIRHISPQTALADWQAQEPTAPHGDDV